MLSTGRLDVNTDMPEVSLGRIGKKPHVVSRLKRSPCFDKRDCDDGQRDDVHEELLDEIAQEKLPNALVFDWLQLPKRQHVDSESTAVGDDIAIDSSSDDASQSFAKVVTDHENVALVESHERNALLHAEVTSLQHQKQVAQQELQELLSKCQAAEREAKLSVQSCMAHTRAVAQLEKKRSTDQRKRRQQVVKVQILRERLATESRVRSQQAVSIEHLSQHEVEMSEKMEQTLRHAAQCKKRVKLQETVELLQLQQREQDMLAKLEEVNKELQTAETKKDQALHAADEAVVQAHCKIETAKANLHSHIEMRSKEIEHLAERGQLLQQRLEAEQNLVADKERLEAAKLQKLEANHSRRDSTDVKVARDLEKQRSIKQRKLDEQKRRKEHLQTKICEDAKVAVMQEVEHIKTRAEAEAAALRARAKAQLKAAQQNASRLQAKMIAEACEEVAAMKELAQQELQGAKATDCMSEQVQQDTAEQTYPDLHDKGCIADVVTVDEERHLDEESGSDWELLHEVTTTIETTSIDEEFSWDIMG